MRHGRPLLLIFLLVAASVGACSDSTPTNTGPNHAIAYAVLGGHVSAPANTINIQVNGVAYSDSADAATANNAGYYGSFAATPDTANNYIAYIHPTDGNPRTLWIDMLATGQGHTGFLSSTDTIRALRAHLDTAGGITPRDSLTENFTLP